MEQREKPHIHFKLAKEPVTLRMDPGDLKLAKDQTAGDGLPYQTYMKSLLHKALQAVQ